jgi:7-carboxy-7-deazaguanine synthase
MTTAASGNTLLPIMEAFYTIQGEGAYTGHAAYFIRTAGCTVGCHWCDVKESWDAAVHPLQSVEEIADEAARHPARLAVVTGGEPLEHDLTALCDALKAKGFRLHIETSGASPLSGKWDWICLSPKKFKEPLPDVLAQCDEFKPVIFHPSDIKWAENFVSLLKNPDVKLFLQPEWSKREALMPTIVEYVKEHPQWQVSLQTHKYMNIP